MRKLTGNGLVDNNMIDSYVNTEIGDGQQVHTEREIELANKTIFIQNNNAQYIQFARRALFIQTHDSALTQASTPILNAHS